MDLSTICVHGCKKRYDTTGCISVPIYLSTTFEHPEVGQSSGFNYSRTSNPTREHLEETVAAIEGGCGAIAFTSGMAAVSALTEIFAPGDHIVASDDLYGGTYRLFNNISKKNGIDFTYAVSGQYSLASIMSAIRPTTKAVFIETPTNPMMHVTDIRKLVKITRTRGILLVVDNTFLPYIQRPLALGADMVLHSATKYLGGHNDVLGGLLVTKDAEINERLRFIAKTTGACLSPFDSYMVIRGIKTLAIRMERIQKTAKTVVKYLENSAKVRETHYCGVGGMVSFSTDSEETAITVLNGVKIMKFAESLGGTESLITYPMLQTHADMPKHEREARGIDECLLRLSVGLESASDLIDDLKQVGI